MADTTPTEPTPGEQAPAAPSPADLAARHQAQQQAPQEPAQDPEDDGGKGGKTAILADLATERDKRQAAETTAQETAAKLDAVLTALGLKDTGDQAPDVDALTRDLQAQRAETAVLRAGHGIADIDALLDSRSFTASLQGIDHSDLAAVKTHIQAFVDANPRYAAQAAPQTPAGVRDAAAGTGTPPPAPDEDMAFANFLTGHAPH